MDIDKKLIKNCIKNNRRAQNALYSALFSFLMNICIRYKNNYDDAGASLNTIYLKILKALPSFDTQQSILPWAKTIAVRHLIDEYRSVNKEESIGLENVNGSSAGTNHESVELKLNADDLLRMVNQLPATTKNVFNLYVIDGYNHREIGEMLDMSEGTSKWHLSEARRKMQLALQKETKRMERLRLEI